MRAVLLLMLFATAAGAAGLTREEVRKVIDDVAANVETYYLFPDKRPAIVGALRAAQSAGRYDVTDAGELARRITEDLRATSGDKHLSLVLNPAQYAALTKPDDAPSADYEIQRSRSRNAGVEELRILKGNVRYVRITNFLWAGDESGRPIEDAARFLRDGDAIVVDLRGNGGGAAAGVRQWISHFFDQGGPLIDFVNAHTGETRHANIAEYLPAGRLTGKPLYVLTARTTGSAAEEFAYHVRHYELGTLVGETTAGAAFNPAHLAVAPVFVQRVSIGQPVHPVTKGNWEGVGVKPHVEVPEAEALKRAHALALEKLGR
jgi:hypothetical protein